MAGELLVLVRLGQSLVVPAGKLATRRWRSWQRLVVADVSKSVGFAFSKRTLRRALRGNEGVLLLTPRDEKEADAAVAFIIDEMRYGGGWKGLSEEGIRARSVGLVEAAQRALLRRLDVPTAVHVADQRSAARDARMQGMLSEVLSTVTSGASFHDALQYLPPVISDRISEAVGHTPQIAELARAIADSSDPGSTLVEWLEDPPAWLSEGQASNWTILGEALGAYGRASDASSALAKAIGQGVADRSYWRARSALFLHSSDAAEASKLVDPAANDPFSRAVAFVLLEDWSSARQGLAQWRPSAATDLDLRATLTAVCSVGQDDDDDAVRALEERLDASKTASIPLALARVLLRRAHLGRAASRDAELRRASELAVRARDARRQWRGDSAEAVAVAADGLALSHDWASVWDLVRTPPEGHATDREARNRQVLSKAAIAAASTGRTHLARQLAGEVGAFETAWINAALAEAEADEHGQSAADAFVILGLWERAFAAAENDDDKLLAARGIMLAGGTVPNIEKLREMFPSAIQETEQLAEAYVAFARQPPSQVIAKLRGLRSSNVHAAVRLAEILQRDGKTEEAASVLREAADRFDDQHLRLMGASALADAGHYEVASTDASEAITRAGAPWSGTSRARRIVLQAAAEARDWDEVVAQARVVMSENPEEEEARWALAFALNSQDRSSEAWDALHHDDQLLNPSNTQRAGLRLELISRNGTARQLIREAVQALRAYGTDEQFAAFVLSLAYRGARGQGGEREESDEAAAISVDASELADLHAETEEFFQRFPESQWFRRITFTDIQDLVAQMGDMLREGAAIRQRFERDVAEGGLPTGFLAAIAGRPYASAFLLRAGGGLRLQSADPDEARLDRRAAIDYVSQASPSKLVTEASALHTSTLLPPEMQRLVLGAPSQLTVTDRTLLDLRITRDQMSLRSTLTTSYDLAKAQVIFVEDRQEDVDERAERAQSMVAIAQSTATTLNTRPVRGDSSDEPEFGPWLGVVEACRDEELAPVIHEGARIAMPGRDRA